MRWGGIFDVDAKLIEITNEEEKTLAPDFWNNPKEAEIYVKNLRSKKKWIEDYNKSVEMADELQLAYEFFKEGDYSPPEPFMELARNPTDENIRMWFQYLDKKNWVFKYLNLK